MSTRRSVLAWLLLGGGGFAAAQQLGGGDSPPDSVDNTSTVADTATTTPTRTDTPTATRAPTATDTATRTPTDTATPTDTPTATASPTPTATPNPYRFPVEIDNQTTDISATEDGQSAPRNASGDVWWRVYIALEDTREPASFVRTAKPPRTVHLDLRVYGDAAEEQLLGADNWTTETTPGDTETVRLNAELSGTAPDHAIVRVRQGAIN